MRAVYILLMAIGIAAVIVLSVKDKKIPVREIVPNYYRAYVYKVGDTVMVRDTTGEETRIGDTITVFKNPHDTIYIRQLNMIEYRQDTGAFTIVNREAVIIK